MARESFFSFKAEPQLGPLTFFEEELKRAFFPDDPNELRGSGKKEQREKKEKVIHQKEGGALPRKPRREFPEKNRSRSSTRPLLSKDFPVVLKKVLSIKDKVKLS